MLMRTVLFWGMSSAEWQFSSDVSGQRIGPIFKRQEVQEEKQKKKLLDL
jgi:hypothetical protein